MSSGGRSQRVSVYERLGDRVQNGQGHHNNNPRALSGATQDFDLRTHISQSRSKTYAREEKSGNSSTRDSNNANFPKTGSKGYSKQQTVVSNNMIDINYLTKAI